MSLTLLAWRRAVADLYREVRRTSDPAAAHETWRAGRDELFAHHPDSALTPAARRAFRGLDYFAYDPRLRFEVPVETDAEPARIEVPTATDGIVPFQRFGRLALPGIGELDAWWLDSYGGGVFVPLRDGTSGRETYGGGRYLIDTVKGADLGGRDGCLVVDLNFAYNPSCAYDSRWSCPLAPPGNVLAVRVEAGERTPPTAA